MPDNRKGTGIQANPPQNPQEKIAKSGDESGAKSAGKSAGESAGVNGGGNEQKDIEKEDEDNWDVPSQRDFFRSVAEQLNITKSEEAKGGTPLNAIINFVERTADLDDLNYLWNAGQAK